MLNGKSNNCWWKCIICELKDCVLLQVMTQTENFQQNKYLLRQSYEFARLATDDGTIVSDFRMPEFTSISNFEISDLRSFTVI